MIASADCIRPELIKLTTMSWKNKIALDLQRFWPVVGNNYVAF
jgi:hypothetical protein